MRAFKNIIFIVILVAILLLSSVWIIGFMHSNDPYVNNRFKSKCDFAKEAENSVDIIVVGDSLSFCSISPMVLWENYGMTSYVLGQSSQRIDEAYNMLQYAYRTQSPKLIILETNTLFRSNNDFITSVNYDVEGAGQRLFPILEVHDIWKCLLFNKQYLGQFFKGFVEKTKVVSYTGGEYMSKTDEIVAVDDNVSSYMDKIIKLCNKHDSQLLLVSSPSPKNYNYGKHNGLVEFSAEKDLCYLDLNLEVANIGIDWNTDTMDGGDHLNWAGGDDYLTKPFSYAELLGRVKALIRRYTIYSGRKDDEMEEESDYIELKGIRLHKKYNEVTVDGISKTMSDIEYRMLLLLMESPGRIFSAQNLYESVWQEPYFYSCNSTVMVHIRKLRVVIEKDPQNPQCIKTVWGKGYKFDADTQ